MSNPISPARQWLFDLLASSLVLSSAGFTGYPEWPQEGTAYPLWFLQLVDAKLVTPIGSNRIDALPDIDIHLVFAPRTLLSVRDAIVDEIMKPDFVHRSRGSNAKGLISACSITDAREIPYRVLDSFYARTVLTCRLFSQGAS